VRFLICYIFGRRPKGGGWPKWPNGKYASARVCGRNRPTPGHGKLFLHGFCLVAQMSIIILYYATDAAHTQYNHTQ